MNKFKRVNVEITNKCNLNCHFCCTTVREPRFMSVENFVRVLQQVGPLTDEICLHLLGEPTLHPDLDKILYQAEVHQVPIQITTNGVLLSLGIQKCLLHLVVRQVNFSLHGFASHVEGNEMKLKMYLDEIFAFVETALRVRPELYINLRHWNWLQDVNCTSDYLTNLIEQKFSLKLLKQRIDVRWKKSIRVKQRLYLTFDSEFQWPDLQGPWQTTEGTCHGLQDHFGVLVDGTVVPCCLDGNGVINLGNIFSESANEILSSERALKIIDGFKRNRLEEPLCQHCTFIERFRNMRKC